jgi:hypothetical protein
LVAANTNAAQITQSCDADTPIRRYADTPPPQPLQCRTVDQVVVLPDDADAKGWYVSL